MRFYNQQHPFYCGVDLHAKTLHLCVLDQAGEIQRHRGIRARPQDFLRTIEPYRKQLVVGAECMFAWYWLSDLCTEEEIPFVLGHALYMRAIHGPPSRSIDILPHHGSDGKHFFVVHARSRNWVGFGPAIAVTARCHENCRTGSFAIPGIAIAG